MRLPSGPPDSRANAALGVHEVEPELKPYVAELLEPLRAVDGFDDLWQAGSELGTDEARELGLATGSVTQPSGTVTLVFTDIEGSTRLLEELGVDAYRDALAEHRRVVRDACARYDGYEVDYEGDAFFYAFASAQAAVAAVSEAMVGLDGGPIRIRVGIHTGEPALDPPKYVGLDVHRAARIMSRARTAARWCCRARRWSCCPPGCLRCGIWAIIASRTLGTPERVFQLGDGSSNPAVEVALPGDAARAGHPVPRARSRARNGRRVAHPSPTPGCSH